jgi:two-component system, NtrC family, nitrogen regulation response regulator GlnG
VRVVLVIEDDATIRRLIADVLMSAGYGVCETFSGDLVPAVPRLDAVVSDIVLSSDSDLDSVRQWTRRLADRFSAPVVVVTGRSEVAQEDPATLGVVDIVPKPFDVRDLLARVERAVSVASERAA